MATLVEFTLNGRKRIDAVPGNRLLLDHLREVAGLTGTKTGCDGGECGACTVLVESLASGGALSAVQRGFHEKLGSQCGYCTPGFIMASASLLRRNARPTEDEIREALGSNICRCTGYVKIIEAVQHAADVLGAGEARHV
jgi:4-hydroxybenzoyl-CoA reductase subunit gamma